MDDRCMVLLLRQHRTKPDEWVSVLKWAGCDVQVVSNCNELLAFTSVNFPDLLVLDINLPGVDGCETLMQLRRTGNQTPVILLGSGGPLERALALDEGADDYLVKPVDLTELIARIRAVLRRTYSLPPPSDTAHQCLASQGLIIDRQLRRAWLNQQELLLTPRAFTLLEYLMTHPDQLISRQRLLDAVWGWDFPVGIRAVDTRIFELRSALGDSRTTPRFIETVSGQGYRFIGTVETT